MRLSSDGRTLQRGPVIWDVRAGQPLAQLAEPEIGAMVLSADGALLAGRRWIDVHVCDTVYGEPLSVLKGVYFFTPECAAFSPDGRVLAVGIEAQPESYEYDPCLETIQLWDWAEGSRVAELVDIEPPEHRWGPGQVSALAFSHDGLILAAGVMDLDHAAPSGTSLVRLWDVASQQKLRTLQGLDAGISALVFSPNGDVLAAGSFEGGLMVADASGGRKPHRLGAGGAGVAGLAFSGDGHILASASLAGLEIWDAWTGRLLHSLTGHGGPVRSVAFMRDDGRLVSAGDDDMVRFWDAESGRQTGAFSCAA